MINNRIKCFVVLLLAVAILGFIPVVTAPAYAATGKVKATTIKVSPTKPKIEIGKKQKIKVILDKKNTKAVKVTIKNSAKGVVKAPTKVTVAKNKKSAQFNVTGKSVGTATVTVKFKNAKGKVKSAKTKITVSAEPLQAISLSTASPKVGDTLRTLITPNNTGGVTYAWYSGDAADNITSVIEGETEDTLTVTDALAGKYIKVVATDIYNNTAEAATTAPVPVPLKSVALSTASPKVGDTLTATIDPANADGVTYAWYSGDTKDSIQTAIEGATGNTLTVTETLAGKYIKVVAKGTDGQAEAATTAPVPVPLKSVSLSPEAPKVGNTLTAAIEPANADGVTYAWYSGTTSGNITTEIEGATGNTLSVTDALAGKYIKVVAKGTDGQAEAATTAPVPVPLKSVTLSPAAPKVGNTLTVTIDPANADGVTYKWYSGTTSGTITTAIEGATGNTLSVTEALSGKYIKVVATGTDGQAEAATTNAVEKEPPSSEGICDAEIVYRAEMLLIAGEGNYLPLNLYDSKGDLITDLEEVEDESTGVDILAPKIGDEIGAVIESIDGALYLYLDQEVCAEVGDLTVSIKLRSNDKVVEKTIQLTEQAGIAGIVGFNGSKSATVGSNSTISIGDVVIIDTYGRELTKDDAVFWDLFTNESTIETDGKCRIIVTSSDPSVAGFDTSDPSVTYYDESTGQTFVALDSTGVPAALSNPSEGEAEIILKLQIAVSNEDKWMDHPGDEATYQFTFKSEL